MEVKWIKVTTDIFSDEKIKLIEEMKGGKNLILIWLKLLCLAGRVNDSGRIFISEESPYTLPDLAFILNDSPAIVETALTTFQRFGMLKINGAGHIEIVNWEKHQNTKGLQKIREQTRKRVQKIRQNQQLTACNANVTLARNANVTQQNRIDKNRIEQNKEKKEKKEKDCKEKQTIISEKKLFLEAVLLTPEEHQKLSELLNGKTNDYITKLNDYIHQIGKQKAEAKYKSHYHVILNWYRRDTSETERRLKIAEAMQTKREEVYFK